MVPIVDKRTARPVNWRGRSGRFYALTPVRIEDFALEGDELYLIARGKLVLWAGSSADIIGEPESRARFRLALDCADRAFHVEAGLDHVERMTIVWDLESAIPVAGLNAA